MYFFTFFQICLPVKEKPFYKCLCKSGYELQHLLTINPDQKTREINNQCRLANPDQFLLYGQQKPGVVRGLDLNQPKREVMLPMIDLSRPTAMDYHASANHIYLADSNKLQIQKMDMKSGQKEIFINSRLNRYKNFLVKYHFHENFISIHNKKIFTKTRSIFYPALNYFCLFLYSIMGMAVDWIGQNLYWTDEGLRGIFVADLKEASKRLLLISKDLVHPRSIVVDSENGVMYWANWPAGPPLGTFFHLFFFLRKYFKFGFQFFTNFSFYFCLYRKRA